MSTELFWLSMLSQDFYDTIYRGVSAPVHAKEVVGGLNATDKSFPFQLMSTVKIPGGNMYYTQMVIHY